MLNDFRRLAGLADPRVLSEAVTVVGWKKTQYSREFWQELATRCAKEIVGKPVPLKFVFKKTGGWGKAYHDIRDGKYDIELDPTNSVSMNAESVAHEIAHVRQYMSGMDLSDKAALEKDAVSFEPVGERILKQMQHEGWKPRHEFPPPSKLLGKKAAGLTPDELRLYDKPLAAMTPDELKQALALQAKLHGESLDTDDLVAAGRKLAGQHLNCRLFVQLLLKTPALEKLPVVKTMRVGDLLQWGENPARHWAVYVGDGNVLEVAEWGAEPQVVKLATVVREYDEPIVRRKG